MNADREGKPVGRISMTDVNIEGVKIIPLRKIPDQRGCIYHMLRSDAPHFETFGEIYFSSVYPGIIKGWHIHRKMVLNYCVIKGMIKLVLYDGREDASTRGHIQEICMGEDHYCLVRVPAMVWNGFTGLGTETAIVANCATLPHDPGEIERLSPFTDTIPYDWSIKHG